jgi:hypothetical protein
MLKSKALVVAFGAAMATGLALAPAHAAPNIKDCGTTSSTDTTAVTPPSDSAGFS